MASLFIISVEGQCNSYDWGKLNTDIKSKGSAVALAFFFSLLSDAQYSLENAWKYVPGYAGLAFYALAASGLEHMLNVLSPSFGIKETIAASSLGAAVLALPFYLLRTMMVR